MAASAATVAKETTLKQAGFNALPDGWSVVQVEELLSNDRGIAVGVMYPGDHDPTGVPLIKARDLTGNVLTPRPEFRITPAKHAEYGRTEFAGGEILMTLVGTVGQCAIVPPEMKGWNSARAVAVIRLADATDAAFVRLCLISKQLQFLMNAWANTTVQATLNLKEIRQLPLPWPPKHERDAIANILGSLDDKIELNRRMNETLEGIARALFKSWFVDFDPVRAKMDGRQPYNLPIDTADLFPDSFEHVDGELIPSGWTLQKLGDVIRINDRSIRKGEVSGEIQYIDIASVSVGRCDGPSRMDFADAPSRARRRVNHGDTIWSCVRPNRRSFYYVHSPPENLLVSTGFAVLSPATLTSNYIHQVTTTQEFTDYLTNNADGSAYPAVRADHFALADVLVPSGEVLEAFEAIVAPMRDTIAKHERESETLAALRDTLLPRLLSGELRVPEAEQLVEEAL